MIRLDIPSGPREIDPSLKNYFYKKYYLCLDFVNDYCQGLFAHVVNRERYRIFSPLLKPLKKAKAELIKLCFPLLDNLEAIQKLLDSATFNPFPRKSIMKKIGRPHFDPEAGFVWELSKVITYDSGSQKGETCWSDVKKIVSYFGKYYKFLGNLSSNATDLKNIRNNFRKNYSPKTLQFLRHVKKNKARINRIAKSF